MTKMVLISTKITIGFAILVYFGGTVIFCNKHIPFCDKLWKQLGVNAKDWRGRCVLNDRQEIDSPRCRAEKDYFQERKRMHKVMCFYEGNIILIANPL